VALKQWQALSEPLLPVPTLTDDAMREDGELEDGGEVAVRCRFRACCAQDSPLLAASVPCLQVMLRTCARTRPTSKWSAHATEPHAQRWAQHEDAMSCVTHAHIPLFTAALMAAPSSSNLGSSGDASRSAAGCRTTILVQMQEPRDIAVGRAYLYEGKLEVTGSHGVTTVSFQVIMPLLYPYEASQVHIQRIASATAGASKTVLSAHVVSAVEALVNQGRADIAQDEQLAGQVALLAACACDAALTADKLPLQDTAARYLAARQSLGGRIRTCRSCMNVA
jgi:hypothetical protein